jgi:hypothetical protein
VRLLPYLKPVTWPLRTVLYKLDCAPVFLYFPTTAMVSLISTPASGPTAALLTQTAQTAVCNRMHAIEHRRQPLCDDEEGGYTALLRALLCVGIRGGPRSVQG